MSGKNADVTFTQDCATVQSKCDDSWGVVPISFNKKNTQTQNFQVMQNCFRKTESFFHEINDELIKLITLISLLLQTKLLPALKNSKVTQTIRRHQHLFCNY